jgi:hypothetical protein
MQSEIGTLIEKEIKQIHQKNEELWDQWESRLEYIVDNTIKEEKLRLVKHLLDQETIQADKVADIDMGVLVDESNYRLSMKKEFIKEYDLLEELKKENKKALQELNSELPKLSFYYNPDLAFKAQEIFSALESEDFDLFLDLVKVDTVDFFYWRIPSTDFNRKNLEGMSIEIEGGNGPITVNALEYVEMFKDFDLHLLEQDKGRQKGSGYDGSCALRSGVAYCENDCYELMVFNDDYCLSYLLEEYGSIEELIPDPYLMRDALSHCSTQSEIWMAFDKSSGFKFIGVYDWYWTP